VARVGAGAGAGEALLLDMVGLNVTVRCGLTGGFGFEEMRGVASVAAEAMAGQVSLLPFIPHRFFDSSPWYWSGSEYDIVCRVNCITGGCEEWSAFEWLVFGGSPAEKLPKPEP
jgi:hypothetical protein